MDTSVLIVGVTRGAHARLRTHPLPNSGSDRRQGRAAHGQIESHRDLEPHARTFRSRRSRVVAFRRNWIQGRRLQHRGGGWRRRRPRPHGFVGEPIRLCNDAAAIRHRAPARGKAAAPRRLCGAQHGATTLTIGGDGVEATLRRADGRQEKSVRIGSPDATAHTALCATRSRLPFGGDAEQRLDPGRRPHEGISVPRYRGRSLLGARRRASESFRSRRGDIASSPTLPPTEGTILAIRRLKKFRPSSSGAGRGARACSIPSGCPASGQFFHA
jgi:hypothetical protein